MECTVHCHVFLVFHFIVLNSCFVHLMSPQPYLINTFIFELIAFTTLSEFGFDFQNFLYPAEMFFSHTFLHFHIMISKFWNPPASDIIYLNIYIPLHLQYFSWFHHLVAVQFHFSIQHIFFIINVAHLLIVNYILMSLINIPTVLTSVWNCSPFWLYDFSP